MFKKMLEKTLKPIYYHGTARYCPVCERSLSHFLKFGIIPREDAECPFCGSLERHRLVWIYFNAKTDLFKRTPKKMLHVAPEPSLVNRFKFQLGDSYITADMDSPYASVRMDITDIQYPENSFDVVYCSHVLEHVLDDRKAMREFLRVLKPNGWAILLVPITNPFTFEDPTVTDPEDREKVFGQFDHVRRYGPDYIDRLRSVGFTVTMTTPADFLTQHEILRMGITPAAGQIFHCRKPTAAH